MAKKIALNKRDFLRVLLTDVLPYEIPFIFTNEGFYTYLKNNRNKKGITNCYIDKIFDYADERETNPFIYKILKEKDSERELYLIHPKIQYKVCDLYKNYNQLITHLCTRSSYSLRHPSKVASSFYEKAINKSSIIEKFKDEGASIEKNNTLTYASTFFEYKDISFLYKFYDSYQFHRIEKKFDYLFKFDIAKCFASISTFQLSRSLKDIQSYNETKGFHSFESVFENTMNMANFGNSHGIVIGPEFSRIFAEILMQSIDIKIKNKLKEKKLIENSDYVIKRYVDDYFLFYNSEKDRKDILIVVTEELKKYKLYCNESKNKYYSVPFITGVTIAKQQYKELIPKLFSMFGLLSEEQDKKGITQNIHKHYKIANQIITDIKCIIFNNGVNYSSIIGYYFTLVKYKVHEIEASVADYKDNEKQCDLITNYLLIIIELTFFLYSMDFRVRSTYLISQTIIFINRISLNLGNYNSEVIKKKIYDEAYLAIKSARKKKKLRQIESLNLLIAIRDIDIEYQLELEDISDVMGIDSTDGSNYFNLMTCLYYIQNKQKYLGVRDKVVKLLKNKFKDDYLTILNDSELAHIFFDSIRCPFLTDKMKLNIASIALKKAFQLISDDDINKVVGIVKAQNWFIDWDVDSLESIERLLIKKELKMPYGS